MQSVQNNSGVFTLQLQRPFDTSLFIVIVALVSIGLVMVASASIGIAENRFHDPLHFIIRQIVYVALGAGLCALMYQIPLRVWETAGVILLPVAFVLLIAVLIPGVGRTVNGATRWIQLGPLGIQPSEFVKLLMVLYTAGYIVRHGDALRGTLVGFIKPLLVVGAMTGLLLLEPDFGAATVILLVTMGMLFIGGVRFIQFVALFAVAAGSFAVLAMTSSYRMQRLTSFLDPWQDPYNSGFQLTQSLIAIGSGSWHGVGLGSSVQKLFYLPEAHNDFMFAILAEELGLWGVFLILLLFVYAVLRSFAIGARAERTGHYFGGYVAYGIGLWLGIQAFVNIGVNMGVLPTKGLTLPFMSAGGSSMLAMCASIGVLLRVHREIHALEQTGIRSRSARKGSKQ
jgi:cell division protein FtsW